MEEDEDFQSDENIETILDVDSFEDQDTMLYNNYNNSSEASSQYEFSQYPSDDESLIVIDDDEEGNDDNGSTNSLSDSDENLKVRKKLNASTSIKIPARKIITADEIYDDTEIEIFDQQVPIKRCIVPTVVNTSTNANLSTRQVKNNFLNLEQIAIPKKNPFVSKLSPAVNSSHNKKSSISIIPSASLMKPTNTISRLQPNLSFSELNYKKSFSKPNITPKNESKSQVYVLPHNGMKYMLKNENSRELKSQSLKLYPSMSAIVKANNTPTELPKQKKNMFLSTSKVLPSGDKMSKFVARVQKLPDGKYKMIPTKGKVPSGLEKFFKRNSHFVKQKMTSNSTSNEHTFSNVIHVVKPSMSPYQMTKHNEIRNFNQNRQVLSGKSSQVDISKPINFGNMNKNKLIPHTATSKDAIENHRNIIAGNGEIILKTNRDKSTSSEFIQVSNSNFLGQSDNQSLNNTKYGKFTLLANYYC